MIMNPSKEELKEWTRVINRAAKFAAHDFPGIEWEDLAQDLWVMVLRSRTLPDPLSPGLTSTLTKMAKRAAWQQRKQDLYATAQYNYRPSDLREILKSALDRSLWPSSFVPSDAHSLTNLDGLDVSADVSWAWSKLPFSYRDILFRVYVAGETYATGTADRRRVDRAIEKITEILNFYRGSPSFKQSRPRRRAINNSTARTVIAEQDGSEA